MRITSNDAGRRLDRVLRKALPDIPLCGIHKMLRKKNILLDGASACPNTQTVEGQTIMIKNFQMPQKNEALPLSLPSKAAGRQCHLDILYEGGGILVLNKAAGIATHGENSLETQVRAYLQPKMENSLSFKSGPLHRLDRNTSGIVTFSTSLDGAQKFSAALQAGLLTKTYIAIFDGKLQDSTWHDFMRRDTNVKKTFVELNKSASKKTKEAVCDVHTLSFNGKQTLALVTIKTGRTHQIRAASQAHGHPLSGDKKYGSMTRPPYFLHALSLKFGDDTFGVRQITAPLPTGSPMRLFLKL
ncbi:MAG: RluA family pseudouridine synthase [Termitinemataceae bacterium]|nr:MAG: RluA family pseudouridine synthase [Termitinemataceae bacterium]